MSRPEDSLPPDLYYGAPAARQYTTSSRISHIQSVMTRRALSLLNLQTPSYVLDIGSGTSLSGTILSSIPPPTGPHVWVGVDISAAMLAEALEKDVDGDLMLGDAGQGLGFRAGTFDAAISISAIQWLCNSEETGIEPTTRLKNFFESLYVSLRRGGRAVLQFYPRDQDQKTMISKAAVKAGFGAGLLIDNEGSKSEKVYLVLTVGGGEIAGGDITGVVAGLEGVEVEDVRKGRREVGKKGKRERIEKWKERAERKGKVVKASSKYTGRKRRIAF